MNKDITLATYTKTEIIEVIKLLDLQSVLEKELLSMRAEKLFAEVEKSFEYEDECEKSWADWYRGVLEKHGKKEYLSTHSTPKLTGKEIAEGAKLKKTWSEAIKARVQAIKRRDNFFIKYYGQPLPDEVSE